MESNEFERAKLTLETAQIGWQALERFFAAGQLIAVAGELDLIDVALAFSQDHAEQVTRWLEGGQIAKVNDAQALRWHEQQTQLWSVVVKPWILVQDKHSALH